MLPSNLPPPTIYIELVQTKWADAIALGFVVSSLFQGTWQHCAVEPVGRGMEALSHVPDSPGSSCRSSEVMQWGGHLLCLQWSCALGAAMMLFPYCGATVVSLPALDLRSSENCLCPSAACFSLPIFSSNWICL